MRALIVMAMCSFPVTMTASALPEQRFNPARCTHYSECIHDLVPYCRKDAESEPKEHRNDAYVSCRARFRSTCREIHCD
jgi:hypothetical protein